MTYLISSKNSIYISVISILVSFAISIYLVFNTAENPLLIKFEWLPTMSLGWYVDRVSASLLSLVLFISLMVHMFSLTYMEFDPGKKRYFAFLGFFTFSMLGLLVSDHVILLFIFWELVGFSSYLLIGFWFKDTQKSFSSRYAFITNRIADAGFLMAVCLIVNYSQTPFISELSSDAFTSNTSLLIGVGLLIGAFGKSAQFPFYTWLPRAMAGPTPVSALIHAATMVTAGVYLLIRVFPVLEPVHLNVLTLVGSLTALIAALSALFQNDIKKVLAYSTVSQLGYMVYGIGVGAPEFAFFHLWTHAFFKAGLFLSAGSVIHYLHHFESVENVQDMRNMGGLRRVFPNTFLAFSLCMLALTGLPFFTGFLSKEAILLSGFSGFETNWNWVNTLSFSGVLFSVFLTAFYMFRQYFLVFFGSNRSNIGIEKRVKEPIFTIVTPLFFLALGSLWIFYSSNPLGHSFQFVDFIFERKSDPKYSSLLFTFLTIAFTIAGILLSYILYLQKSKLYDEYVPKLLINISKKSFYLDDFYISTVSKGFLIVSVFSYSIDKKVIDYLLDKAAVAFIVFSKLTDLADKLLVDGFVKLTSQVSNLSGRILVSFNAQRVQLHVFWLIMGVLILIYILN